MDREQIEARLKELEDQLKAAEDLRFRKVQEGANVEVIDETIQNIKDEIEFLKALL